MTTLAEATDALAAQIQSQTGLTVFDHVPGQIVPPAAIMEAPTVADYTEDLDEGSLTADVELTVLVSSTVDVNQRALYPYTERSGSSSIYQAVKADRTLGLGNDVQAWLLSSRPLGLQQMAAYQHYGGSFMVRVIVGGD